ncbi:MAG: T9SS type A sorting domain-containing protein [Vicingaceae bacterium]|nr:T9SS type A sorting domain-containing protein [Vicingaceae bacterium]
MKKLLLMGLSVVTSASLFSQIFTDDFESYSPGNLLVQTNPTDWDTWTVGGAGGPEDAPISTTQAASGSNSVHFLSTTTGGGPDDVILKFAQVYTSGSFTYESNFFVVPNKGAYFNMQETHVVGGVWAIDCFMLEDGTLKLSNSGTPFLSTTYPVGQWFNLRLEINLTTNLWELYINNVSQGSFSNPTNSIGILDLYPTNPAAEGGNEQSEFYIDDVSYNHIPASLPAVNGGVTFVNQLGGIAGQSSNVDCTVRNLGSSNITSFDITYTYGANPPVMESVGPISLASLATYNHTFATPATLLGGSNNLTVTISNVNGAGPDADPNDDSKSITINPVTPAVGKIVVGEEATGTWCQWCPRGAVFMDYMETTYSGFWAGVAVHNNDPMADPTYDSGLGTLISGYPSSVVDRGPDNDPSTMEQSFLQRIVIPPTATVTNGATYNSSTRQLEVSLTYDFQVAASGNWRVACVLTEDGVTGTTGYAQSNAYAGGGSGPMGGYENLPNPVPASQMVYDHVGRTIVPSFTGQTGAFPTSIANGSTHTVCFSFTLPAAWDDSKMHIVGMLIDPAGDIDNAGYTTIAGAVSNGLAVCSTSIETEDLTNEDNFKLFPNPTNGTTFIDLTNSNNDNVNVTIMDMSGKIVAQRDYNISGTVKLPILTNNFDKGIYIVTLTVGNKVQQQKLVVQ